MRNLNLITLLFLTKIVTSNLYLRQSHEMVTHEFFSPLFSLFNFTNIIVVLIIGVAVFFIVKCCWLDRRNRNNAETHVLVVNQNEQLVLNQDNRRPEKTSNYNQTLREANPAHENRSNPYPNLNQNQQNTAQFKPWEIGSDFSSDKP